MRSLSTQENVDAPDGNFIYGRIRDYAASTPGTPVNEALYGDIHQLIARMMQESGVVPNGLPDNDYNGFQIYEAFRKLTKPYNVYTALVSQSGTSAPTVNELNNEIGAIVWTRISTGVYRGTLSGAFISSNTWTTAAFQENLGTGYLKRAASSYVEIRTVNTGGSPADSIMNNTPIEIRVYDV